MVTMVCSYFTQVAGLSDVYLFGFTDHPDGSTPSPFTDKSTRLIAENGVGVVKHANT